MKVHATLFFAINDISCKLQHFCLERLADTHSFNDSYA